MNRSGITNVLIITRRTDLSLIQDLTGINSVRLSYQPNGKIISFLKMIPGLKTISVMYSAMLPKSFQLWLCSKQVPVTFGRIRNRKQGTQLPQRYVEIYGILHSDSGASAKFMLQYLSANGAKSAQGACAYIGLGDDEKNEKSTSLCLAEIARSIGVACSTRVIDHIWGALMYVLPVEVAKVLKPNTAALDRATILCKKVETLHKTLIYQRQLNERIASWDCQFALKHREVILCWGNRGKTTQYVVAPEIQKSHLYLEKSETNDLEELKGRAIETKLQRLLKYQLGVARYGDKITEVTRYCLYQWYCLGKDYPEIAAQLNANSENNEMVKSSDVVHHIEGAHKKFSSCLRNEKRKT